MLFNFKEEIMNKLVNKLQSQVHSLKTRLANSKHKIK